MTKAQMDALVKGLEDRAEKLREDVHTDREDTIASTLEEIVTVLKEASKK